MFITVRDHSQLSQGGQQSAVFGVLLEVVSDSLNDGHVIEQLSWPLTNQCGKALSVRQSTSLNYIILQ